MNMLNSAMIINSHRTPRSRPRLRHNLSHYGFHLYVIHHFHKHGHEGRVFMGSEQGPCYFSRDVLDECYSARCKCLRVI